MKYINIFYCIDLDSSNKTSCFSGLAFLKAVLTLHLEQAVLLKCSCIMKRIETKT